jgi:hypothetical protein
MNFLVGLLMIILMRVLATIVKLSLLIKNFGTPSEAILWLLFDKLREQREARAARAAR